MLNFNNHYTQRWVSTFFINKLKKNGGTIPWLDGIRHGLPVGYYHDNIEPIRGINQFFILAMMGEHPEWRYPFFTSISKYKKLGLNMKDAKTPVPVIWTKYVVDNKYFLYNIADCVDSKTKDSLVERIEKKTFVKRSHKNAGEKFDKFIQTYSPLPSFRSDSNMVRQWDYDFSTDTVLWNDSNGNTQLGIEKIMHGLILSAFHSKRSIPKIFQKIDRERGGFADLIASFGETLLAASCGYRKSFISEEEETKTLALKFAKTLEYDNRVVCPAMALACRAANYIMGIHFDNEEKKENNENE